MKTNRFYLLAVVLVLLPCLAFGAIRASITCGETSYLLNSHIVASVDVDMTGHNGKLGSYTAELRWNPRILRYTGYEPGYTQGFNSVTINDSRAAEGVLVFAGVNPAGSEGMVNIFNVAFLTIGRPYAQVSLSFRAMAAAYTFESLLPYLQVSNLRVYITRVDALRVGMWPNPFNPTINIGFDLPESAQTSVVIYNLLGQAVATLVDGVSPSGENVSRWSGKDDAGRDVPAGVYLCRITAGGQAVTKQIVYVK